MRFLNDFTEENSNGKNSHLKIPIEVHTMQTLTKQLFCSDTKKQLCDTVASPSHSSHLQYNHALIRYSDKTRGLSHGET